MSGSRITACAIVSVLAACGSTSPPEPVVVPVPSTPTVATDPRVGELQVMLAELLDRLEVLNARIERLEGEAIEVAPPRPTETGAPAVRPAPAVTVPSPRPALSGAEIGEAYSQALELYGRGQIDRSRETFQRVFDSDPNGDLADNALYWIGETWFSTGNFAQAISTYQRIDRDYPGENKAPDAMLKMGMAYARTSDLVLARRTYEQLIERYPYSVAASAARAEIRRISY